MAYNRNVGRPAGGSNRRTEEGREYARLILVQRDADLVSSPDGVVVDASAIGNPVVRRLRQQAREGVGSQPGLLPPNVFIHLCDRLYGKVVDRVKLALSGQRPFEALSDEELAERAALTARALNPLLGGAGSSDAPPPGSALCLSAPPGSPEGRT